MRTIYDTDISDEQLKAIGRIAANWSLLEYIIGRAVGQVIHGSPADWRILVAPMKIRLKLEALERFSEIRGWPETDRERLKKLQKIIGAAADKRNLVIHGLWVEDESSCHHLVKLSGGKRASGHFERMTIQDIQDIASEVCAALRDFDFWWSERATDLIAL